MTQNNINKAYPALIRLSELRLPVKKARSLYTLIKKTEDHFQFAIAEERKYLNDAGGIENEDGTITFKTPEQFAQFQDRMAELKELIIEWDFQPVILTENEIGDQTISPSDIYNLEGFVSFE